MAQGWVTVAMGWVLVGMSLWCTMQSIPGLTEEPVSWTHLPLLTACVGLALIAGFLSLLPGGVGVREWIIVTLLAGTFGSVAAFVSAILLRLVWLATEVVLSAILYWIKIK